MVDSVSSNNYNYNNSVSQNSSVNNTASTAPANNVQAQPQNENASTAPEDGVALSQQANQMLEESTPALNGNEDNESCQVGGAGVNASGDMSVAEMRTALAEARGISEDDVIIVSGTGKDDEIAVTAGKNGSIDITVNGKKHHYSADEASRLIINGAAGNDSITVDKKVQNNLIIMGGDGDDTIKGGSGNDTIVGGEGNDTLSGLKGNDRLVDDAGVNELYGGAGNDVLVAHSTEGNVLDGGSGDDYLEGGDGNDTLRGGSGYDVMYGLSGNDYMDGGSGKDYIDGGIGNDQIYGRGGNDILIGGQGDDYLDGSSGDDLFVGGAGADEVQAGRGDNHVINDGNDTIAESKGTIDVETIAPIDIPESFSIDGDHFAQERIESDLDFLANTRQGQKMFSEIVATGHSVTFDITPGGSSCGSYQGWNSDPSVGSDSFVHYNTSKISLNNGERWANRAPVVSMYHEMCHSYNAATGTMNQTYYDQTTGKASDSSNYNAAKGLEWQAVGLANSDVVANDADITENGLRSLLGFARRERY